MSRSCYSEDYPGQLELFRANLRRSMQSKAGQARLRELRHALLALPVKALERETFVAGTRDTPQVCALGAWALAKCDGDVEAAGAMVPSDGDDMETFAALKPFGWPRLVVLYAIFINDEHYYSYDIVEGPQRWPGSFGPVRQARDETPAERYARVLRWVEGQITEPKP